MDETARVAFELQSEIALSNRQPRRQVTRARALSPGAHEPFEDLPTDVAGVPAWLHKKWGVPLSDGRPAGIGMEVAERMATEALVSPETLIERSQLLALARGGNPATVERNWRHAEIEKLRLKLRGVEGKLLRKKWRTVALVRFIRALRAFPGEWPTPESVCAAEEAARRGEPVPKLETFEAIQIPMAAIAALAWYCGFLKRRPVEGTLLALTRLLKRHPET